MQVHRTLAWRTGKQPELDVSDFEQASDRGLHGDRPGLEQAARLYRGDLLPECSAEWVDADRERLRRQAVRVLTRLVELLEQERACTATPSSAASNSFPSTR